jgi:hypothetical protein
MVGSSPIARSESNCKAITYENGLPASAGHFCVLNGPDNGPPATRRAGTVAIHATEIQIVSRPVSGI